MRFARVSGPDTAAAVARRGGREAADDRAACQPRRGRQRGASVRPHLPSACTDAVVAVGSVGATAMRRALKVHLRATGQDSLADALRAADDVAGLVGWGALAYAAHRRGQPPVAANREPWGYLDPLPA